MKTRSEDVVLEKAQGGDRRLLIIAGDPYIRDACAALADEFDCKLYSTSYTENIVNIVKKFRPRGVVIDLGLFEENGIELHEFLLNAEPPLNVLFLEGEDEELTKSAGTLAASIGLKVKGNLQMPVSVNRLDHVLQHMV